MSPACVADTTSVPFVSEKHVAFSLMAVFVALSSGVQWQASASTTTAVAGVVDGVVTIATAPSRRLTSPGAYPGRSVTVGPSSGGTELANVAVFVDLAAQWR